jgi:hypothetical protein
VRALLSLLCAAAPLLHASEELSREYRIKAAYLYNLIKFIQWPDEAPLKEPADAPAANAPPLIICVYGYNPFDRYLEKLETRTVRGRALAVRYIAERQSAEGCQILFISRHNTSQPALLASPEPYPPVLTVSDDEDFLGHGMVALVTVNNNVQLDINLTRARKAGFTVSANLLEVARRVE